MDLLDARKAAVALPLAPRASNIPGRTSHAATSGPAANTLSAIVLSDGAVLEALAGFSLRSGLLGEAAGDRAKSRGPTPRCVLYTKLHSTALPERRQVHLHTHHG